MKPFYKSKTMIFNAALAASPFVVAALAWLQSVFTNEEFLPALASLLAVLGVNLDMALSASVVTVLVAVIGMILRSVTDTGITFKKLW